MSVCVRPSDVGLRVLCDEKEHTAIFKYHTKSNHSSFLTTSLAKGDVSFQLKFAVKVTHPLKNADFDPKELVKKVQLSRIGRAHVNEL